MDAGPWPGKGSQVLRWVAGTAGGVGSAASIRMVSKGSMRAGAYPRPCTAEIWRPASAPGGWAEPADDGPAGLRVIQERRDDPLDLEPPARIEYGGCFRSEYRLEIDQGLLSDEA